MTVMRFALTIYALKHYPRPADQTRYVQSEKHAVPGSCGSTTPCTTTADCDEAHPVCDNGECYECVRDSDCFGSEIVWQDNATPSTFV